MGTTFDNAMLDKVLELEARVALIERNLVVQTEINDAFEELASALVERLPS